MNEEDYLWVARDKSGDLYLFAYKPIKNNEVWYCTTDEMEYYFKLNPDLFPNVKWEDEEPLAVMLQQAIFKS